MSPQNNSIYRFGVFELDLRAAELRKSGVKVRLQDRNLRKEGPEPRKVHITSSPSGGEIYVDGKFYGNTPSDIVLDAGEHVVKVTLGGKEWTRTVQITGGEIQLHAELPGVTVQR